MSLRGLRKVNLLVAFICTAYRIYLRICIHKRKKNVTRYSRKCSTSFIKVTKKTLIKIEINKVIKNVGMLL